MRYPVKAIVAYFCLITAAAAQISTTSPDLLVTPSPGGGYAINTRSPIIDQSSAGGPILASAAQNIIKIGGFLYKIAPAESTGFLSGWTALLINVSKTAATLTSTSTFEGAGNASAISLAPGDWVSLIADGNNYLALSGRSLGAPVAPVVSADGTKSSPPNGAPLFTADGVWSWGAYSYTNAGNAEYQTLQNGANVSGIGYLMEVAHGGKLYVQATPTSWWIWSGSGWTGSPAP